MTQVSLLYVLSVVMVLGSSIFCKEMVQDFPLLLSCVGIGNQDTSNTQPIRGSLHIWFNRELIKYLIQQTNWSKFLHNKSCDTIYVFLVHSIIAV